ncbi:MAG: prephenate dehydrogenase/arogenate dehydrogenase family protein [bacterium]
MHKDPRKSTRKTAVAAKQRVTIMGLGLMGGSLGLALRKGRNPPFVCGYARRAETRKKALEMGAVDAVFASPQEAARGADIIVVCTPVLSMAPLAKEFAQVLSPGAVVTDVGSTKQFLISQMAALRVPFIGSHPIAGSENSGLKAARADLYRETVVILTPTDKTEDSAVAKLSALWQSVGAETITMPAGEHDSLIAATSHLPHLLAALLVRHVAEINSKMAPELCGSGFRDTTRIADGSPEMWHDIVATNAPAVRRELRKFRKLLDSCLMMIDKGDFASIRHFLGKSQKQRRRILSAQN